MELTEQVVSLELANRLKELGVRIDSYFAYFKEPPSFEFVVNKQIGKIGLPAYTATELGALIPGLIRINDRDFFITMDCEFHVYYENMDKTKEIHFSDDDDTEANARAKCLIHLIENDLQKP